MSVEKTLTSKPVSNVAPSDESTLPVSNVAASAESKPTSTGQVVSRRAPVVQRRTHHHFTRFASLSFQKSVADLPPGYGHDPSHARTPFSVDSSDGAIQIQTEVLTTEALDEHVSL